MIKEVPHKRETANRQRPCQGRKANHYAYRKKRKTKDLVAKMRFKKEKTQNLRVNYAAIAPERSIKMHASQATPEIVAIGAAMRSKIVVARSVRRVRHVEWIVLFLSLVERKKGGSKEHEHAHGMN